MPNPHDTTQFKHPTGRRQKRSDFRFELLDGVLVAYIPLTQGYWAIVDMIDFPEVSKYLWHAAKRARGIYATGWIGGKEIDLHRLIPVENPHLSHRDHKNQNPLDNRRCNLRACTASQNLRNVSKKNNGANPYKGVSIDRVTGRWRVTIGCDGVRYHGGMHGTPEDAARAYDALARKLHGEFAVVNFPEE